VSAETKFTLAMPSHEKRLFTINVLSSERRDKVYFGYAESRKTAVYNKRTLI